MSRTVIVGLSAEEYLFFQFFLFRIKVTFMKCLKLDRVILGS